MHVGSIMIRRCLEKYSTDKYKDLIDDAVNNIYSIINSDKFLCYVVAQTQYSDKVDKRDSFISKVINSNEYEDILDEIYDNDEDKFLYGKPIKINLPIEDSDKSINDFPVYIRLNTCGIKTNIYGRSDNYGGIDLYFYLEDVKPKSYTFNKSYLRQTVFHEITHIIDKIGLHKNRTDYYNRTNKDYLKYKMLFSKMKSAESEAISYLCYVLWSDTEFNAHLHTAESDKNLIGFLQRTINHILPNMDVDNEEDYLIVKMIFCRLLNINSSIDDEDEFNAVVNKFTKRSQIRLDKFRLKYLKNKYNN